MAREVCNYDQLFAGEVPYIVRVKAATGEYKRGDLLEATGTGNYAKAAAVATVEKYYAICADDVTVEEDGAEIVTYVEGYFKRLRH